MIRHVDRRGETVYTALRNTEVVGILCDKVPGSGSDAWI